MISVQNNKLDINAEFRQAIDLLENSGKNLFITGKAGTGKSTLLDYFCKNTDKNPVVLAPTGVAALNVKGQTIHRFFNFYIDVTPEKILSKEITPRNKKIYKKISMIIIDEVSMLRADLLDCIDVFLRMYGRDQAKPFGGVQMVFVGDLYQLPPVVGRNEREIFENHYNSPYFFSSQVMIEADFELIELETVYRQKDEEFVHLLNKIRNNTVEDSDIEELNKRYITNDNDTQDDSQKDEEFKINLTTTNQKADEINEEHLNSLSGRCYKNKANISGDFGKEYYPTLSELRYKIGSQIMLLNNDSKQRWVNGTMAIIEDRGTDSDGEQYLKVRLSDNNRVVSVYPHVWEVYKFKLEDDLIISHPAGSFTQYPFRLAWAVTIHKSQGKTFDNVAIDIGKGTFAGGQVYVALSRCTSFQGITLTVPIKKHHIRTDYRISRFLTSKAYKKAEKGFSMDDKIIMIEKAIANKTKLEMTYLKANDTKSIRQIIPLTVGEEQYKDKKFMGMNAYCLKRNEERMFSLIRILDMKAV